MASIEDGSATTLTDFLSDAFPGEMEDSGLEETPNDGTSPEAGGAPPPEPTEPVGGSQIKAEGEKGAGESVVPAQGALDKATQPIAEPDPLANAVALTYTVNTQSRTFDDIKVIPGVGAVISAEALPKLQQRLSERDALYERSQHAYQQQQALEALTAWTTKGQDGRETTLTGRDGIEAMRIAHAQDRAALETLSEALTNPRVFASLVGLDTEGNLVLNRDALQSVMTRSELNELRAVEAVKAKLGTALQAATQPQTQDYSQAGPQIAAHYAKTFGGGLLSDEDQAFLAQQVRGHLRAATAEDVQANPQLKLGETVVDAAFTALVQRMAELKKSSATAVTTATHATQQNEARLAGVIAPQKPKAPAVNGQRSQQREPSPQQAKADEAFDMQERLLSGRW